MTRLRAHVFHATASFGRPVCRVYVKAMSGEWLRHACDALCDDRCAALHRGVSATAVKEWLEDVRHTRNEGPAGISPEWLAGRLARHVQFHPALDEEVARWKTRDAMDRLLKVVVGKTSEELFSGAARYGRMQISMFCVRFEGLPEDLECSKDELLMVLRLSAFYEPADRRRSVAQLFARILHIQQTLRGTRVGAVPYLAGHLDRMGRVEAAVAASDALPPPLLNVARCVCYAGKTDQFYCDYCDDTRRHDAREAARDLEARFVMATNTEMSMVPETPAHFEHLVDRAITVTDEETRELQERYLKRLAVTTCLPSCGACGARDPKLCYERWRVEDLPPCFRIHPAVEPASSDRLTGAAWFRVYRKLGEKDQRKRRGRRETN